MLGAALFLGGLGPAIWARLHLGRNWGMPQTLKSEPELITSGPYRLLRHPIYTGILTAAFPGTYPAYRARTWMLVPLVL